MILRSRNPPLNSHFKAVINGLTTDLTENYWNRKKNKDSDSKESVGTNTLKMCIFSKTLPIASSHEWDWLGLYPGDNRSYKPETIY